ncbi:hypothetical protein ICV00_04695 [Polynucleobacter asymbioticus]|nr:hypothetical protein ICV00_04695 [Polynucleobacter asymbioticus]
MKLFGILSNNWQRIRRGEFFFHLEMRICNAINRIFDIHPPSSPFLSGDTYKSFADIEITGINDVQKIKNEDIIFLSAENLDFFQSDVLENIRVKFSLITHHGDQLITSEYSRIADYPLLIHWFAQNNQFIHPKITAIPIGLEDAWRHNNGVVKDFVKLRQKTANKVPRVLYGFNVNTNKFVRSKAMEVLSRYELADSIHVDSRKYRKVLNEYMFIASPAGNGIDCHRTWEALYLGTIPIVVGGQFYSQFDHFPGLILESWDELSRFNEKELITIYEEKAALLGEAFFMWENYWRDIIKKHKKLA